MQKKQINSLKETKKRFALLVTHGEGIEKRNTILVARDRILSIQKRALKCRQKIS